jgi:hypothetical protein
MVNTATQTTLSFGDWSFGEWSPSENGRSENGRLRRLVVRRMVVRRMVVWRMDVRRMDGVPTIEIARCSQRRHSRIRRHRRRDIQLFISKNSITSAVSESSVVKYDFQHTTRYRRKYGFPVESMISPCLWNRTQAIVGHGFRLCTLVCLH